MLPTFPGSAPASSPSTLHPASAPVPVPTSIPAPVSISQMSLFATMPVHPVQYGYGTAPPQSRQFSSHATSSAFSPSANPDEDWTKISDLAERRRIQNRIAQRNYRKKLKKRLEDLERRAGPSDERPTTLAGISKARKQQQQQTLSNKKATSPSQPLQHSPPQTKAMSHAQYNTTPPNPHHDDDLLFPNNNNYNSRERSHTPPEFPYSTYPPPPEDVMLAPYSSSQQYQAITSAESYPAYLAAPVPATLPPMTHYNDTIKREPYAAGDDGFVPYVNYGFIPGIDVHGPSSYDHHHSDPHTPPPLSHFDHSASCSDAGYEYPTTPLSMPPHSPNVIPQQ